MASIEQQHKFIIQKLGEEEAGRRVSSVMRADFVGHSTAIWIVYRSLGGK